MGTRTRTSSKDTPEAIAAEGHALIGKGHALLAEAARLRASARARAPANDTSDRTWIPVGQSPLGKRRTLTLARAGVIASTKVGRAILIERSSLERYLDEHRRGTSAVDDDEDEDLFGAIGARGAA